MEYPEIPDGLLNTGGVVFKEKMGEESKLCTDSGTLRPPSATQKTRHFCSNLPA
jgi:hypothetical protein